MSGESGVQDAEPGVQQQEHNDGAKSPREAENVAEEQTKKDDAEVEIAKSNSDNTRMLEDEEMPTYMSLSTMSEERRTADIVESDGNHEQKEIEGSEHSLQSQTTEPNEIKRQGAEEEDDDDESSVQLLSPESTYEDEELKGSESTGDYSSSSDEKHRFRRKQHTGSKCEEEIEDESDETDELDDEEIEEEVDMDEFNREIYFERASSVDIEYRQERNLDGSIRSKSQSLQDLSPSKTKYVSLKKQINHQFSNIHESDNFHAQRKNLYKHVPSKVKQYIQDIKDMGRKSMERRQKSEERILDKKVEEIEVQNDSRDHQSLHHQRMSKIPEDRKSELSRLAIQQLQIEYDRANNDLEKTYTTMMPVIVNSETSHKSPPQEIHEMEVECDNDPLDEPKFLKRANNVPNEGVALNGDRRLQNGQQETPILLNARTLSYEEYMKVGSKSEVSELERALSENEALRKELENLREVREGLKKSESEKANLKKDYELAMKDLERSEVEKVNLKKELSAAVEVIAELRKRNETRTVTVQTEIQKPLSSASAISSIAHWSQSEGSYPELNSSATTPETPRQQRRQMSQEFVTSSRILETLSSITCGLKNKTEDTPRVTPNLKKRKASEVAGGAEFSQPFKIPNRRPSKGNSTTPEEVRALGTEGNAKEVSQEGYVDGIKCFVYKEDENSDEQSFLIQAQDVAADDKEPMVERECGPYLIGNVEVRMTEVNGTINIWGKEINQSSQSSIQSELMSSHGEGQTPRTRRSPGPPVTCSTEKKSATDMRTRLNFERSCAHRGGGDRWRPYADSVDDCAHWHAHATACCQRPYLAARMRACCCAERYYVTDDECACAHVHRPHRAPPRYAHCEAWPQPRIRSREEEEVGGRRQCYVLQEERGVGSGGYCTSKGGSTWQSRLTDTSLANCKTDSGVASESRSNQDDASAHADHTRHLNESNEARKRRLTGKRVRTVLMDFLKGCGDCRASPMSGSAANFGERDVPYTPRNIPEIIVTSDTPSTSAAPAGKKCEEDAELERMRMEIDKLLSRSYTMLKMLKIHCSDTTGN